MARADVVASSPTGPKFGDFFANQAWDNKGADGPIVFTFSNERCAGVFCDGDLTCAMEEAKVGGGVSVGDSLS